MNQITIESHTHTYTTIILNVDTSSFFNKTFHSVHFVFLSRYMQGSPLTRKKQVAFKKNQLLWEQAIVYKSTLIVNFQKRCETWVVLNYVVH